MKTLLALMFPLLTMASENGKGPNTEPWYLTFTIGLGSEPEYSDGFQRGVSSLVAAGDASRNNLKFNLGFYVPIETTPLTYGVRWISMSHDLSRSGGESIGVGADLVNASVIYNFGQNVVQGSFARMELGPAQTQIHSHSTSVVRGSEGTHWGWDFTLGLGLVMPVNERSRFMAALDYHAAYFSVSDMSYTAIAVGMMF